MVCCGGLPLDASVRRERLRLGRAAQMMTNSPDVISAHVPVILGLLDSSSMMACAATAAVGECEGRAQNPRGREDGGEGKTELGGRRTIAPGAGFAT